MTAFTRPYHFTTPEGTHHYPTYRAAHAAATEWGNPDIVFTDDQGGTHLCPHPGGFVPLEHVEATG